MAWPEKVVADWNSFETEIRASATMGTPLLVYYLHRGQSVAAWPLQSSLRRALGPGIDDVNAIRVERRLLTEFKSQAHIHLKPAFLPKGDDPLDWWQVMQHYGAPTRLIDWTASVWVAAYFAVVDHWDEDGAVWTFHPATLEAAADKVLGVTKLADVVMTPNAPKVVGAVPMSRHSERTVAQQGHFTVPVNVVADQEAIIHDACSAKATLHRKLIIPKSLKPEMLRLLRQMNVSAGALFPSADGLGWSIRELARLASRFKD